MAKRTPTALTGPLGALAARVRAAARDLHTHRSDARQIEELKRRRDQVRGVAQRAASLATTVRILRDDGPPFVVPAVVRQRQQDVALYRQKFEARALQTRFPNVEESLEQLEASLMGCWRTMGTALESADALANLLARFPQLRDASGRIQRAARNLSACIEHLPTTAADISVARERLDELNAEVVQLEGDGLDADVRVFLQQAAAGLTLDALLGKPTVLKFLRDHQLLSAFTVTLRPNAQVLR